MPAQRTLAVTAILSSVFVLGSGTQVDLHAGQAGADVPNICGQPVPTPARLPPPGSGPILYVFGLCFPTQGNVSVVDPATYLHYIQLQPSRPSQNEWVSYDAAAEQTILDDFQRLWATNFLDDLRIEASDYRFANGATGRIITYFLEERQRLRAVTYDGDGALQQTQIDDAMRERGIELRLDSFLDRRLVARASGVLRELMADRGYTNADVSHHIEESAGLRLVNLTFTMKEGPRLAIRDVRIIGNRAIDDAALERQLEGNRAQHLFSSLTRSGYYRETEYEEDAQRLEDYYRDRGFIEARVGQADLRVLDDSPDGRTRWVQLRIPVDEGGQYRIGSVAFEGNTVLDAERLATLFPLELGEYYRQADVRRGLENAREVYGAGGYMEFVGFPDLRIRPESGGAGESGRDGAPIVDLVVQISEGPRYAVGRITFVGNTTTRDEVIRREMRLLEGDVYNTAALQESVRRLNQLGYFEPLEGNENEVQVAPSASREDTVDVTLHLRENNRNQVQFGAGVSQYEGVFGSLSYTTANFLGRGESLTVTGQKGARASTYQLAFTEPFLFNRPITAGFDLYTRKVDFLTGTGEVGYSEVRSGVNLTGGLAVFDYSRLFLTYGYEVVDSAVSSDLLNGLSADAGAGVPLFDPLLDAGRHIESRITPSFVHSTVDNPLTPRIGRRFTFRTAIAGGPLGGTTNYVRPEMEFVQYVPHFPRTAFAFRANAGWLRPYGDTDRPPYYLRYFLGGEQQIRGTNIQTVGPTDDQNRALGGDKFLLFNAEYYFDISRMVRALLFHDAGQAFSEQQTITLRNLRTSSGVEVRVFMPVLNVPLRFIYAWNVYRDTFQPARTFKFAVGTTF